jgi:MFS transporter, ACS family, D-galactonate transporter
MMAAQPTLEGTAQETPKGAWKITFLLFLFMLVNFADKIVVGLAGVPIMRELELQPGQFGLLGSSFFFLYSIAAIVVGFIVNRVEARWVLLVLALVWAVAQFPMVGTVGFTTLLICRIILGAGEGPAPAVAVHAIFKWFPDEKRTLPNAVLSQGAAFGVIVAVPALNWVIVNYGWHYAFGALGVVGLMWVVVWLFLGKEGPLVDTSTQAAERKIPYLQLLTSRTFVGCVASTFGAYWALSLGLTWFTPFIVNGLGFSQQQAGFVSILPWMFGATVVLLTGWISQVLMARGVSSRGARGVLGSVPLIVGGAILATLPYIHGSSALLIALLVVGAGLSGSIYVVCAPMIGEFTPVSQRGAVIAIYGALYTLAGIVAPYVMGDVIQHAGNIYDGFMTGYTINAAILIASGLLGLLLLWPNTERARLTANEPVQPKFA